MRRRRRRLRTVAFGVALVASAGAAWRVASGPSDDVLLIGARVLTLAEPTAPGGIAGRLAADADAVLIRHGRIAAIGAAESLAVRPDAGGVTVRTLGDVTLMPGFVDAHSHFPAVDLPRFGLDLTPPPDGEIDSLERLHARLERTAAGGGDGWILGFDYDEAGLDEARHPTRAALDRIAPSRPIWLRHRSGHMGVGNSAALAAFGIDESWAAPPGGRASRDATGRLDGLLQERAAPSLTRLLGEVPLRLRLGALAHARDAYLAAGVTTVQNGHASPALEALLLLANALDYLPQHVVTWRADRAPSGTGSWSDRLGATLLETIHGLVPVRANAVPAAIKLVVDGSPQGRTAWLVEPYLPDEGLPDAFRGVPTLDAAVLAARVVELHADGRRLAIHTNGDAATDAALDALETALAEVPRAEHGHLLVHLQTVRTDQLRRMASLGVEASFFPGHVRYWGDWHRERALGPARASRISPLAEADAIGVRYSIHTDTPVTPMRPFDMLAIATERRLPSGRVLGPVFRIDRERALRALTLDPARQAGVGSDRGSLEVGKRADLIAVAGDPLSDDPASLRVVGAWIDGRHRYADP